MILAVIQASMLRTSPARLREPILLPPSPVRFRFVLTGLFTVVRSRLPDSTLHPKPCFLD